MRPNGSILIVDADSSRRFLISDWLRAEKFEVFEASSEADAFANAQSEKPDVILLRFGPAIVLNVFQPLATIAEASGTLIVPVIDRNLPAVERAGILAFKAAGFLNDELRRDEILASIRAFVRQKRTVDEFKQMVESSHGEKALQSITGAPTPLRERLPHVYKAVLSRYEEAIKQVLEHRIYKITDEAFEPFRHIAKELFLANATARDAVELHYHTLRKIAPTPESPRAQAYLEVGRTTIIGLMGDLLTLYRDARGNVRLEAKVESESASEQSRECVQK